MNERQYNIEFNGITGQQMNVIFAEEPKISAYTPYAYKRHSIPGRFGNLISSTGGRDNATIKCVFWVISKDVHKSIREIKRWLSGKGELSFSNNADAFYEVLAIKSILSEVIRLNYGRVTVEFEIFPYEFMKDGQYEMKNITYNAYDECMPTFVITGNGLCDLTVNGKIFKANVSDKIIINTRKMLSYKEDLISANTLVSGDYEHLHLKNGKNQISVTDGFELSIIPNWGYKV